MKIHNAETGDRYSDDSGWERRVAINTQAGTLVIEVSGSTMSASSNDIDWLISALQTVRDSVGA